MHVIITLAGRSQRFAKAGYKGPKAFITLDGLPMIAHVVKMFSPDDTFHFIVNKEQAQENPDRIPYLKSLARLTYVKVIDCHDIGPIYSCLQADVPADEPAIVSYCDFYVQWNYELFVRQAQNFDASLSVFRGTHPASLGNTLYAYIRNEGELFIELKEKQSFTNNRLQEFASTGIYYFSHWQLFLEQGQRYLARHDPSKGEAYVSLLYNQMAEDKLEISIYEVEKFICWGTPEDVSQYQFWLEVFQKQRTVAEPVTAPSTSRQINLIPMAGRGDRFRKAGYRVSKPMIQIGSKPMVLAACESLPPADHWLFVAQEEELKKDVLPNHVRAWNPNSTFVAVFGQTEGQAETCLLAKEHLRPHDELFISSCDYLTFYDHQKWQTLREDPSIDGVIWTYRLKDVVVKNYNAFAYCIVDPGSERIKRVVEKATISTTPAFDPMVVGCFWYRCAADFIEGAEHLIKTNTRVNNEFYIATSINFLIERGKKFCIFDTSEWVSFGDPLELEIYHYWEDFFSKEASLRRG